MMILLGQHGQRQDYAAGLDHIRYAAQTCDENAPQGAYVSLMFPFLGYKGPLLMLLRSLGIRNATGS